MSELRPVEPIRTTHLFAGLHGELMAVLRRLSREDWERPTAAGRWRVRDITAHLLDGDLRQLSFRRDDHPPVEPPFAIEGYADLVRFLDGLNAVWVEAFGRVSPPVLVELLERTGPEVARVFDRADPFAPALFGVAWAGESASANWFDVAREYTERWHHQQQIRDAVAAPPLTAREWLHPVLDTFLRALPHAYRDTEVAESSLIGFRIEDEAGGEWALQRTADGWALLAGTAPRPLALITTDADTAWRLLTKGLTQDQAAASVRVDGAAELAEPFLRLRAIMG